MKMPKFVLRIAGRDFLLASNRGVATLISVMAEAVPVDADLNDRPPVITLEYAERPDLADYLQEVRCVKIPRGVVWKRKRQSGEVEIVRPVAKAPKALKPPPRKALPGWLQRERRALPQRQQLALEFGGSA